MNEKFRDRVKKTGKSVYKISQESGIPYTTLSELMNEKKSINNTSAETVYKLSLYLKCSIDEILNDCILLENGKGTYRGYSYQWKKAGKGVEFHITEDGKDVTLLGLKKMCQDLYGSYISLIPETLIDDYIDEKQEWSEMEAMS